MVDYLVQNSLGAIWMEMYPDSKLCENWPYFAKNQDLKPREPRPVKSLTFLDPACGSGHFLLVAFDLLAQMYEEEARLALDGKIPKECVVPKDEIATTILESNLHGIDIDLRSVQLSWLVLYLKMREHQNSIGAPKSLPEKVNLVAADASLLNTPEFITWCEEKFKEEPYAINIIKGIAGRLSNLSEIGSLARPEEDLKELIHKEKERLISAWKKEKAPKQVPLFRHMLAPEQQELPFDKVTDDQFWGGVLSQVTKALDEYYRDASERGDTRAQVLVHEASRGFKFLELCNKRYDVVATNPPYIGSGNMAKHLKDYVQKTYPQGKRDLYSAFILRNLEWAAEHGIIAMVTMQSWMFLRSFVKLREEILSKESVQSLVHLGARAFAEISGEVVNCCLFTLVKVEPSYNHRFIAFRLIGPISPAEKMSFLKHAIRDMLPGISFVQLQTIFLSIPHAPMVYWLREKFFEILSGGRPLSEEGFMGWGISTSDNDRFLRLFWECTNSQERWKIHLKGGTYRKWAGLNEWMLDWQNDGEKLKSWILERYPYLGKNFEIKIRPYTFGKQGWTYSSMARGCVGFRILRPFETTNAKSPALFLDSPRYDIGAILNSRLSSYFVRTLACSMNIDEGHVGAIPLSKDSIPPFVKSLTLDCIRRKEELSKYDLIDRVFAFHLQRDLHSMRNLWQFKSRYLEKQCALMHANEGINEKIVFHTYQIGEADLQSVLDETGTPAGWYPLIESYDSIPVDDIYEISKEVNEFLGKHKRIKLSEGEFIRIKSRLYTLYEAGSGGKVEDVVDEAENAIDADDEEETELFIGKRIPIPTETFLEELSLKMEIHPMSIYWLLKEMREKEGLVCWPECKRYVEDYFTVMILRMLGFRWPKQVESNEPVPDWADKDGIIPITEHTEEKILLERIRDRIGADFGENRIADIEGEFADILYNAACKEAEIRGKTPPKKKVTLPQWLEKEFFKRHTSQFKKRPIAWHLTSSNGTFQVLIFCHEISFDMFKNLKNRHLAKVQSYYSSLLERARRGESVPGGLTVGKLSDIEIELEEFSNKLDKIITMPYEPLIDDGVRVNIAPLQKLGLLASPVLAAKDVNRAIADRNRWREDDKEQATVWKI